jgi:hypothetical protein
MIKIAFIGSDSTHTEAFGSILNSNNPLFKDVEVVSIWSSDREQALEKAKILKIQRVSDTIEDALEGVDLAMVITRFSDNHRDLAEKSILKGVPTFVDKPFTSNIDDAKYLSELSIKCKTPLCSFSPLRFSQEALDMKRILSSTEDKLLCAKVTVPANCNDLGDDSRLQSPLFYGIHGMEVLLEIIGPKINSIKTEYNKTLIASTIEFEGGNTASFHLVRDTVEFYTIEIYTQKKSVSKNIILDGSYYIQELRYILDKFMNGANHISLESTCKAVEILEKIEKNDPYKDRKYAG